MDATESLSHALLNNANPHSGDLLEISFRHSFNAVAGTSYLDIDPSVFSVRWADSIMFDFNLPHGESSPLVHADQIFSNGQLVPFSSMKKEASFSPDSISHSVLTRSVSLDSLNTLLTKRRSSTTLYSCHCMPQNPGRKSPVKILRKYLNFLLPLYKKVKKLKMISSPRKARSCGGSPVSSARLSGEFSGIVRVFDVEIESSIHDAVLHCKKSIAET